MTTICSHQECTDKAQEKRIKMSRKIRNAELVKNMRRLYQRYFDDARYHMNTLEWTRFKTCQAWTCYFHGYMFLRSYDEVVALFDESQNLIVEYGHFTSTTYQHIGKWRNYLRMEYFKHLSGEEYWNSISQVNLELIDWYN